jgi:exodeoxyribonuclease VII large subunit
MVIETMAPAGVGALLAQLERLKAKLQAEGLFDPARKRPLPASPAVIGVVTSPTGAVIRDILHRIRDRWPCHVLVWPVVVQGADAAAQVAAAVRGFNAIVGDGAPPRPDAIIVARGGGSIEDLWPFNDEVLARTVAASAIPVISAVGHETDTTLIDFVADRRAPTPTAAAELATPVLADLRGQVLGLEQRLGRGIHRALELRRARLDAARRGLPRPDALLGLASQRFDLVSGRLSAALGRNVAAHERDLARFAGRLNPHLLERPVALRADRLAALPPRLAAAALRLIERRGDRLERAASLLRSLHPEAPLARGFALVRRPDGEIVRQAQALKPGEALQLKFADGLAGAHVDGGEAPKMTQRRHAAPEQGQLF